ncbi:ATP-binding protein [Sphingomonas soli]|uniref:ATP-binding protein n=1 Tax=Sphingomonas soli TaxID=266127 RepID=UPI0009FCAE71|nr:ATP-binding protein [Sphingomonas soli]
MRGLLKLLTALSLLGAMLPAAAGAQTLGAKPATEVERITASVRAAMVATPEEAERLAATGEAAAQRVADPRERLLAAASFRWMRGEALVRMDKPDEARPLLAQALKMIEPIQEPIKLRGDILMSFGSLELVKSKAAEALGNYLKAFDIFKQIGEKRGQAIALQNLASLYYSGNDGGRAEKYYQQAMETYDGDPMLTLSFHNNRGNVLLTLERYGDAAKEYSQALEIARKQDNPVLEARVLINLARTQVDLKQFAAAQATLDRGFALIQGKDAPVQRRHLLATAARLAADQGDYAKAERLIRECFAGVDLTTTTVDLRNAHVYAHDIFAKVGDAKLALAHLEAIKRLNDESTKVATSTGAALMAAQFDFQGEQYRTLEQQKKAEEFRAMLFAAIGIGSLMLAAALGWGLLTMRRSRNKVAAANIELGESNAALEKALKAKTEFLATTSHEIRTPLNGILGMTQVMLSDPRLDAQVRDRVGIVHDAGVTMRSLVDDILDVAKMETGNLTVDAAPMDVCAVLKDVTRMWEEQARAKGLGFHLELTHAPCWIVSDAGRLRQIVFNLLSNAIKFTEAGSVTVRAIDEGAGDARRLKLIVADTGIGIPAEKFGDIFESFRQVDTSTTRKYGGTGLGLTICRNLAEALGGEIHVESEDGHGSRFIVDLPLVPAEAPQVAERAGASTGTSLLILDRNPIARSMLKTLFEPRVATLRFVASADEALGLLGEGGVTHLLIDEATAKAGEGDAMDTIRALAGAAGEASITVLWLKPEQETKAQLAAAGAGRVVEKPVAGAALIEAIIPQTEENSASSDTDRLATRAA